MWRLVPALVREMGQAYPELDPRRGADRGDPEARGDALPRDARARPRHPRRGDAQPRARAASCRRSRLQALRHLRLPARPHRRTRCARASLGVDTDGFDAAMERQRAEARKAWAGSGEAATETIWFAPARAARRDGIPGLRDRDGRGRRAGAPEGRRRGRVARARARRASSSSTRRRSTANPAARSAISA